MPGSETEIWLCRKCGRGGAEHAEGGPSGDCVADMYLAGGPMMDFHEGRALKAELDALRERLREAEERLERLLARITAADEREDYGDDYEAEIRAAVAEARAGSLRTIADEDPRIDETPVEVTIYGCKRTIPRFAADHIDAFLAERHSLHEQVDRLTGRG